VLAKFALVDGYTALCSNAFDEACGLEVVSTRAGDVIVALVPLEAILTKVIIHTIDEDETDVDGSIVAVSRTYVVSLWRAGEIALGRVSSLDEAE
jgi:hypothetical protein